ncbi:protein C9orf41, putative [Pediculus humanus corporis]|uniref:carnosine N-methyltransferase n=1 Tax=Pediculus humanus subsp. corporis TaxID=121224 RepID=E0VZ68_PEDHC|nr:protein C9orf41, putative [Pediculus humanus corporis]EEB18674.1 protein C9orf41, putative [Pediculus humanus corporis]
MGEWEDEEERAYFQSVISAFKYYRTYSLQRIAKSEQYFKSLPDHHQKLMECYLQHLNIIKNCVEANDYLIKMIIKDADYMFSNVNPVDQNNIQPERKSCYDPIITEILSEFPPDGKKPEDVKILVPGAGLGRLAFEIAKLGYTCQGNEFSLFMLLASQFVLNKCCNTNIHKVYPWVHQFVNNLKPEHQTQSVSFPDINPRDLSTNSSFTMAAGDFLEVYTEDNVWDCVATCFFIDCANNVAAFIETIYKILKPGGIWINLGPLLYHFSDVPQEDSIEPSYEVVRQIIVGLGFVIEKEKMDVSTSYAQNPNSMLQYQYRSVFFICRKCLNV